MDVAILGVGPSGRRIVSASADAGLSVDVYGEDANAVVDAIEGLGPARSGGDIDGTTDLGSVVSGADVIVEARTAEVGTARARIAEVEEYAPETAVIAYLTDYRPITTVAVALQHPDRFVGLHPIVEDGPGPVEVIRADQTSDATAERAASFVADLGWSALPVGDGPGFAAGRLRLATQVEAMRLVESGVADAAAVDETMTEGYGQDVGPLEQADRQGLDAVAEALAYLADAVGERYEPPRLLARKVADGDFGAARGEGFYVWESGSPVEPAAVEYE